MKHPLLALLIVCSLSGVAQAQGFTGHASGTLGMLNPKILLGDHFTIEPLTGLRLLSSPHHLYDTSTEEGELDAGADTLFWYIMTGLPLDFQLKFGFLF